MKKLIFILILLSPLGLQAATPLDVARQFFGELVSVSTMNDASHRKEAVTNLTVQHFAFDSFYERALADHWKDWTDSQKAEFDGVFRQRFAENIAGHSTRLKTLGEVPVRYRVEKRSASQSEVIAGGTYDGVTIKVRLYLVSQGGQWKVHDLDISGALLSRNYRGMFNYVLRKYGFAGLLSKITRAS